MNRAALAACLVVAVALACTPAKQTTEIVFWQSWPAEAIQPLVDRFEAEHPGVEVRMERLGREEGRERIAAALASDSVPDLCQLGSSWMPRLLAEGRLIDWSAGAADLKPALRGWEMCAVGDALYGIPWVLETRALYYNRTLLARAGLDSTRPPTTWPELHSAAGAVQRLGGRTRGYGVQGAERRALSQEVLPYIFGNGGRLLSDDLRSAAFDSAAAREALEFYLGLREVGVVGRQDELDRRFKEGRLGLQLSGPWLLEQIPRESPGLRYGVALVPRPAADHGTHASWAAGEVLVTFAESRHKQLALELARFLVRPENALALARAVRGVHPAHVGADTAAWYRERPNESMMVRQLETARFTPNHPAWEEMESALEEEIAAALENRTTAAEAVAAAHARLDELAGRR